MFRSIGFVALFGLLLAACAGGASRDFGRTGSDKAPHFSPGVTVTGGTVRGGG